MKPIQKTAIAFAAVLCAAVAHAALTADVIFLGEVHDNPTAHLRQAEQIAQIQPAAVVFEMLTPAQAEAANSVTTDQIAAVTDWANSGWPDYAIYAPVFEALDDAVIYGAGTDRDDTMAVFQSGAVLAFGERAALYGLDVALPAEEQAKREDLQFTAHCDAMPREMMAGMVEVQRFRDAMLADAAYDALRTHGAPIVVITGAGHARTDWGAPTLLKAAHPETTTYALAFVEADDGTPYDKVELVPEAEREDPCLAFQ